jgi:hypothetical protein
VLLLLVLIVWYCVTVLQFIGIVTFGVVVIMPHLPLYLFPVKYLCCCCCYCSTLLLLCPHCVVIGIPICCPLPYPAIVIPVLLFGDCPIVFGGDR